MIAASSTVLGRPDRGASWRPEIPPVRYRSRQLITVGREIPRRLAMAEVPSPAAARSTTRARRAIPAGTEGERTHVWSVARSAFGTSTTPGNNGMAHDDTSHGDVKELMTRNT